MKRVMLIVFSIFLFGCAESREQKVDRAKRIASAINEAFSDHAPSKMISEQDLSEFLVRTETKNSGRQDPNVSLSLTKECLQEAIDIRESFLKVERFRVKASDRKFKQDFVTQLDCFAKNALSYFVFSSPTLDPIRAEDKAQLSTAMAEMQRKLKPFPESHYSILPDSSSDWLVCNHQFIPNQMNVKFRQGYEVDHYSTYFLEIPKYPFLNPEYKTAIEVGYSGARYFSMMAYNYGSDEPRRILSLMNAKIENLWKDENHIHLTFVEKLQEYEKPLSYTVKKHLEALSNRKFQEIANDDSDWLEDLSPLYKSHFWGNIERNLKINRTTLAIEAGTIPQNFWYKRRAEAGNRGQCSVISKDEVDRSIMEQEKAWNLQERSYIARRIAQKNKQVSKLMHKMESKAKAL